MAEKSRPKNQRSKVPCTQTGSQIWKTISKINSWLLYSEIIHSWSKLKLFFYNFLRVIKDCFCVTLYSTENKILFAKISWSKLMFKVFKIEYPIFIFLLRILLIQFTPAHRVTKFIIICHTNLVACYDVNLLSSNSPLNRTYLHEWKSWRH